MRVIKMNIPSYEELQRSWKQKEKNRYNKGNMTHAEKITIFNSFKNTFQLITKGYIFKKSSFELITNDPQFNLLIDIKIAGNRKISLPEMNSLKHEIAEKYNVCCEIFFYESKIRIGLTGYTNSDRTLYGDNIDFEEFWQLDKQTSVDLHKRYIIETQKHYPDYRIVQEIRRIFFKRQIIFTSKNTIADNSEGEEIT